MQEFEETRSFRHQSWRSSGRSAKDHSYEHEQGSGSGSSTDSNLVSLGSSSNNGSSTRSSSNQDNTSSSLASGGRGSWPDRQKESQLYALNVGSQGTSDPTALSG